MLEPELGHSPFENSADDKSRDGYTPSYPIFSGVKDPMVRALAAMVVGCDACPKGVVGSGPKDAHELLSRHSDKSGTELHEELAREIAGMKGSTVIDKDAVLCLAQSLVFEKTHDGGYVHGTPPPTLASILKISLPTRQESLTVRLLRLAKATMVIHMCFFQLKVLVLATCAKQKCASSVK